MLHDLRLRAEAGPLHGAGGPQRLRQLHPGDMLPVRWRGPGANLYWCSVEQLRQPPGQRQR